MGLILMYFVESVTRELIELVYGAVAVYICHDTLLAI